jgi:hypothetical protein
VSWTINIIFWLLHFLHCALWYNYATWTNEMHTFQINTLIQFFMSSTCFKPSWEWTQEVQNMQKMSKNEKLTESIYLKGVHFVGSCCMRIFWHYGHRKWTSPFLILISLLFDGSCQSKKFTGPSDLAIVLSGRHNTHLVTLSSMSVLTNYWHSSSTPLCSHSHWCISSGSQCTGPCSLQININI